MGARERKALAWQAAHMKQGEWADNCPYSPTGYAIWRKGAFGACYCHPVPKSYAPYLTAEALGRPTP